MILLVKKVSKEFKIKESNHKTLKILDELSFQVEAGKTIAILGKSGSGKSTLLSLIAGLDQPNCGEIIINGTNISSMKEKELTTFRSRKIAIVFQQFHLLPHLTAIENVSLPLELIETIKKKPDNIFLQALSTLKSVGLEERKNHFPRELSGGEQQRVAIARALTVKPDLLLADEPTGNLDHQTSLEVSKQFFKVIKENHLSLVLFTHDDSIAKMCNQRYFLQNGKLNFVD